jgi:hypothetical protein
MSVLAQLMRMAVSVLARIVQWVATVRALRAWHQREHRHDPMGLPVTAYGL